MATDEKQLKYPSVDEQTGEKWYIHSVEYYLLVKRLKQLMDPTWMNLKNIKPSGRSQAQ
jgi:hypothetical protein